MVLCASLTGRSELKLAAFAFASFVALASCEDRAPPPPQKKPAMTGPVNIGAVIRQVHFAWREKGGEWTSGHTTYESRFAQDGLEFTPFHRPAERAQALAGAPVRFAMPLLTRGDHPLGTRGLRAGNSASGGVHVQRGAFVEEYENSEDGVEQRWRFEAGPPGEGPLEVRVQVLSGEYAGATQRGLHFKAGPLMVRYGHGTWIDARGRRTAVPARYQDGAVVLQVSAELLASSVFPAVLDPVIGPELTMDAPVSTFAARPQTTPAVASDGSGYFVVWGDGRGDQWNRIYGARVGASGTVLDPTGIELTGGSASQTSASVAWDGTRYLVVYADAAPSVASDIRGVRVSATGALLDTNPIAISQAAGVQSAPAVAWNGSEFLVVWADARTVANGEDIYGARVSGAGVVLDASGIAISTAAGEQSAPAVACASTSCLVAFQDRRSVTTSDLYAARVSNAGAVLDPTGFSISALVNDQRAPAVAWDGTNYFVVWQDARNLTPADIYGARVSVAGAVLDTAGVAITTAPGAQASPSVGWDGTNYLVAWDTNSDVAGARVSPSGVVLDGSGVVISAAAAAQSTPALAWNGTSYLVAWSDSRSGGEIYAARVSGAAAVLDATGTLVSSAANSQTGPAVGSDGTDFLVVWHDSRANAIDDLYGARLSGTGALLDPAGIAITTTAGYHSKPAVAWTGSSYLVVWQTFSPTLTSSISGARVSAAGAVLDAVPITISTGPSPINILPAVARNGSSALVVWTGYNSTHAARVSEAGAVLDSPPLALFPPTADRDSRRAVACDGTSCLVAWGDRSSAACDLLGARVTAAGAVLDPAGFPISNDPGCQLLPAVVWSGTNYLVAWVDWRIPSSLDDEIHAVRVSATGLVLDATAIGIDLGSGTAPALAWDGTNSWLMWRSGDNGTGSFDVVGRRVSGAGAVIDATRIVVSNLAVDESDPAIACSAAQRCLVSWDAFDGAPAFQTNRVRARLLWGAGAPAATAQSVTTAEDTPLALTLEGIDPDGDPITFDLVALPTSGTLVGTAPNLTYSPAANFNGTDSFTFTVHDGTTASPVASVSITITAVNDPPTALGQTVSTAPGVPVSVILAGTDLEGSSLAFTVTTQPGLGTLSGTPPNLTFVPAAEAVGADTFTFTVNDGTVDSAPAVVALTITTGGSGGGAGGSGGGSGGGGSSGRGCGCTSGGGDFGLWALGAALGLSRRAIKRLRSPRGVPMLRATTVQAERSRTPKNGRK